MARCSPATPSVTTQRLQFVQSRPRTQLPHDTGPTQQSWSWSTAMFLVMPLAHWHTAQAPSWAAFSSAYWPGCRPYVPETWPSCARALTIALRLRWWVVHLGPGCGAGRSVTISSVMQSLQRGGFSLLTTVFSLRRVVTCD